MKRPGIRPLDILIFFLIAVSGVFLTVRSFKHKGSLVIVKASGIKYEYSASQNGSYTVQGELGPTSFEIKDGRVRITDSPCPGKTCISQGWHNPLVCLPNKVIITVEGETDRKNAGGEFDAISQ